MLLPIALALLAQPLAGGPRLAVRPGPPDFDPDRLPARSAFAAAGLALGGRVEIECRAYAGGR